MKKVKADFAVSVLKQTGKPLRKSREYSLDHGKKKELVGLRATEQFMKEIAFVRLLAQAKGKGQKEV